MVREALTSNRLDALEPREAAALFIARRAEGLTRSEQELLDAWLEQDASRRAMFDSADRAWRSFDAAEEDEVLGAMRARALSPRRGITYWQAAAAAVVLMLTVGAALLLAPVMSGPPTIQYASRGEVMEVDLPDGSSMTLDADSSAAGRFGPQGRSIELQRGRAYFAVAPDPSRPFAVTAGGQRIVAIGTQFDVNLLPDGLTVTMLDGRTQVSAPRAAPIILEEGQQYITRAGETSVHTVGDRERAISWRHGLVSFDDYPLVDAAAVMNRYSAEKIIIDDPAVSSLPVSGQFRAGENERFADTLAEMHRLRAVRRDGQIVLLQP